MLDYLNKLMFLFRLIYMVRISVNVSVLYNFFVIDKYELCYIFLLIVIDQYNYSDWFVFSILCKIYVNERIRVERSRKEDCLQGGRKGGRCFL